MFDLAGDRRRPRDEWQPRFPPVRRHISVVTSKPAPPVFGTKGLAGQVIDILIDNALKHGAGAVTLMIDGPSVVVIDQGRGVAPERLKTVFDGPSTRRPSRSWAAAGPSPRAGRRRNARVVGNHPLRVKFELVRGDQAPTDHAPGRGHRDGSRRRSTSTRITHRRHSPTRRHVRGVVDECRRARWHEVRSGSGTRRRHRSTGPKNHSPSPEGGISGDGERKETPVVCRSSCEPTAKRSVNSQQSQDRVKRLVEHSVELAVGRVRPPTPSTRRCPSSAASTTMLPPSSTLPSRISTAAGRRSRAG